MSSGFIRLGQGGSFSYKDGVATVGDLPTSGNANGDIRGVLSNTSLYMWNGSSWIDTDSGGGGGGVSSLNTQTGALTLVAGTNITITPGSGTLTINSTGGSVTNVTASAPLLSSGGATPNITLNGDATDAQLDFVNASDATKKFKFDLSQLATGITDILQPLSIQNTTFMIRPTVDATANIITQNATSGQIFIGADASLGGANSGIQYSNATTANRGQIRLGSYVNATSVAGITTATSRSGTVGVNAAVVAGQDYSKWTAQAGATTPGSLPISGAFAFKANTVNSLTVTSDYHIQLTNLAGTLGDRLLLGSEGALQLPHYTAGLAQFDASGNITSVSSISLSGTIAASNFSGTSSGTNTGDQTITLTGDVTGSGTGSFATTLAATTNSTLTTLSALSLPGSQVTGNISGNSANITASSNSTLTTLSALSLPGTQVTGNISGNAANVTGVVAIANGGTGQSTALAAFDALSPLTTAGDILYENSTPVGARLPIGSTGQVLTVTAGLPTWVTPAGGGGMTNPMTTLGDMIYGGTGGTPLALPIGNEGAALEVIGGIPTWVGGTPAGGGRGVFGGGNTGAPVSTIDYITISTTGNATAFGSLTSSRDELSGCSSSTRGLFNGGFDGTARVATIDYITIATTGNGTSFGNLISGGTYGNSSCSNQTRGITAGGIDTGISTTIEYVTIATTGNATSFGSLAVATYYLSGCSSSTIGLFAGGAAAVTTINYVTIGTLSNSATFGDLSQGRQGPAAASSNTRGVFLGGYNSGAQTTIDYVTIASASNATSFGSLTTARYQTTGTSNNVRAVAAGGTSGGLLASIEYVTIATTSNASSFGNLTSSIESMGGCSDSHGGL